MDQLCKLLVFLNVLSFCHGFFAWENCVKPSNTTTKVLRAHGCEDKKDVVLSCSPGYKISILKAFFGHGHGHKSTCDSSWLGQNCGAIGASAKVRFLCQDQMTCTISPTSSVLGTTSCTFGLDSDLIVEYTCHKDLLKDTVSLKSLKISPSPIVLPGKINFSTTLLVSRHLPRSTKLKLDIHAKKLELWVPIPCVSDYGSCTYDNFCDLLRGLMFSKCDREMENEGITCDCPIPTGLFTVPTQSITVTKEQVDKIPVWDSLISGQYWIKAEFLDVYERPLGCFILRLEVDVNSDKKKRSFRIKVE